MEFEANPGRPGLGSEKMMGLGSNGLSNIRASSINSTASHLNYRNPFGVKPHPRAKNPLKGRSYNNLSSSSLVYSSSNQRKRVGSQVFSSNQNFLEGRSMGGRFQPFGQSKPRGANLRSSSLVGRTNQALNSKKSHQFNMRRATKMITNPKKLKEDISILTRNISKLTENKIFFETLLENKLKKFIKVLKTDLKDSKNTEIVKKCLSLIHKHSEYDPTKSKSKMAASGKPQMFGGQNGGGEFSRSVATALRKIEEEIQVNEEKFKRETAENGEMLRELLMSMNNTETLQVEQIKLRKISQKQVENQCEKLKKKLNLMEIKNKQLKEILDNEIYQLTLEHEKRGRDIMQEKVIQLALNTVKEGGEDPQTVQLANRVEGLFQKVRQKAENIDNSEYDELMKKKKELEKRITLAKQVLKV